jgi:hypothetical protein
MLLCLFLFEAMLTTRFFKASNDSHTSFLADPVSTRSPSSRIAVILPLVAWSNDLPLFLLVIYHRNPLAAPVLFCILHRCCSHMFLYWCLL